MTADLRELRRPTRVLLVLDRPVIAAVVALALTHGRCVTRVARTADAAVDALRA
jgi:CheY-like chemotaxis protein